MLFAQYQTLVSVLTLPFKYSLGLSYGGRMEASVWASSGGAILLSETRSEGEAAPSNFHSNTSNEATAWGWWEDTGP